jgi:hypothetical protein
MNKMQLVLAIVSALLKILTPDLIKKLAQKLGDTILDFAEDHVLGTASTVDDAIVLPVCKQLREGLNIPDED